MNLDAITSHVTFCCWFQEKEPQVAYPMSITWTSNIADSSMIKSIYVNTTPGTRQMMLQLTPVIATSVWQFPLSKQCDRPIKPIYWHTLVWTHINLKMNRNVNDILGKTIKVKNGIKFNLKFEFNPISNNER